MHKDGGRMSISIMLLVSTNLNQGYLCYFILYIMGNVSEEFYKIKFKKNTGISCKSTLVHHSSFSSSWTDDDWHDWME